MASDPPLPQAGALPPVHPEAGAVQRTVIQVPVLPGASWRSASRGSHDVAADAPIPQIEVQTAACFPVFF
jgi:hypothetical protein